MHLKLKEEHMFFVVEWEFDAPYKEYHNVWMPESFEPTMLYEDIVKAILTSDNVNAIQHLRESLKNNVEVTYKQYNDWCGNWYTGFYGWEDWMLPSDHTLDDYRSFTQFLNLPANISPSILLSGISA